MEFTEEPYGPGSFGFEINDQEILMDWWQNTLRSGDEECGYGEYSDYQWYGIYIEETGDPDCNSENDTEIYGFYDHTWEGTYSSWGISGGIGTGAMISVSYTEQETVRDKITVTEDDGETPLVVSRDEADYQYRLNT